MFFQYFFLILGLIVTEGVLAAQQDAGEALPHIYKTLSSESITEKDIAPIAAPMSTLPRSLAYTEPTLSPARPPSKNTERDYQPTNRINSIGMTNAFSGIWYGVSITRGMYGLFEYFFMSHR